MSALKVFIAYSRKDKDILEDLRIQLKTLERLNQIEVWYDGELRPGENWDIKIMKHLENAEIILLLISADFIASDYAYTKEMKIALARHEKGEARVMPVIVRHCLWKRTEFAKLQVLPKDGDPILGGSWSTRDEPIVQVGEAVSHYVKMKEDAKQVKAYYRQADTLRKQKKYKDAILYYKKVIDIDFKYRAAHFNLGFCLVELGRYEEAIEPYNTAIKLDRNEKVPYYNKGIALAALGRYKEAIASYNKAIELDPKYTSTYNNRGNALRNLGRYEEALASYNKAIELKPNYQLAIKNRKSVLAILKKS